MSGEDAPRGGRSTGPGDLTRGLLGRTGNLLSQGSRLPSLRTPRDLTLGGPAKRTFAPTIPTRREKGKEQSAAPDASNQSSATSDKRGRGRGRGGRGGSRGRGGRGNDLIQLQSSVFADGPAERMMRARGRGGGNYAGKSEDNYIHKPKVSFDFSAASADPEEDKKRLQEIFKDDFIDDGDDDEIVCEKDRPVILPLRPVTVKPESESPVKVKKEVISGEEKMDTKVKIKSEPDSDHEMESLDAIKDFIASTSSEPKIKEKDEKKVGQQYVSCKDVFNKARKSEMISGREEIFLVQLPDILPGLPRSKDEKKPKVKQEPGIGFGNAEPSTSQTDGRVQSDAAKTKSGKEKGTSLSEVSEGHIGKIQLMKSGRTRLLLGNAVFDIELGTQVGFLQDLVSLRIDDGEPSGGSLSTLGHVKHKIVCVPDMDVMSSCTK